MAELTENFYASAVNWFVAGGTHPLFRLAVGDDYGYLCLMETVVKKFTNAAEAECAITASSPARSVWRFF
jgi:hypothetical protein